MGISSSPELPALVASGSFFVLSAAVERDYLWAASSALGFLGVCGEIAARHSLGPGSFRVSFFDTFYGIKRGGGLKRCFRGGGRLKVIDWSLYVITDRKIQKKSNKEVVEEAADAGASVIQLREKDFRYPTMGRGSSKSEGSYRRRGIPLIINDRIDIALAVDADGVHLGQEDMPLVLARKIAPSLIIGYSVSTVEEALKAEKEGADYLGAGTVFPTSTKKMPGNPLV